MIVGVIPDLHVPFEHRRFLHWIKSTFDWWGVEEVICIGDLVDNHAISYHEQDPDGRSAGDELLLAEDHLIEWYKCFPSVKLCLGNHDRLPKRKAKTEGLSHRFIRNFREVWNVPNAWTVHPDGYTIEGVFYTHGEGRSGVNGTINHAKDRMQSVVQGHLHSYGGCMYARGNNGMIFGLNVGCGIDEEAYAFEYGKHMPRRPTLGCGIVINGKVGHFIPMVEMKEE